MADTRTGAMAASVTPAAPAPPSVNSGSRSVTDSASITSPAVGRKRTSMKPVFSVAALKPVTGPALGLSRRSGAAGSVASISTELPAIWLICGAAPPATLPVVKKRKV